MDNHIIIKVQLLTFVESWQGLFCLRIWKLDLGIS